MTATRDDMIRKIARRLGYSGTTHSATGGVFEIIGGVYDDTHAELVSQGKASWDANAVPDGFVRSVVRYIANEAEQEMDRSRDLNVYESEKRLAWRDICRVVAPLPDIALPEELSAEDYGQYAAGEIRYI